MDSEARFIVFTVEVSFQRRICPTLIHYPQYLLINLILQLYQVQTLQIIIIPR